jgi:hypothetical protein
MKVWPTNDLNRKFLKHPTGGPFRAEGPSEWPDDSYTARRIADGDVTTDEPQAKKDDAAAKPKDETQQQPSKDEPQQKDEPHPPRRAAKPERHDD